MTAVDQEMIDRVKAEKRQRRSSANQYQYQDRPRLAFIVHSFNRISNIDQLVGGLRSLGEHELIVCEDGSLDGSRRGRNGRIDRQRASLQLNRFEQLIDRYFRAIEERFGVDAENQHEGDQGR